MKVRVKFKKYGVMKFIGHLDVMRYFQKALRRADIPVAFTKGFSPHMVMSFANPLGVGLTSDGEYFDLEITRPLSTKEAVKRLNEVMVEGMEVLDFVEISGDKKSTGMSIVAAADYLVTDKDGKMDDAFFDGLSRFTEQEKINVMKKTKRSEKEMDIRPLIYEMKRQGNAMYMRVSAGSVSNLKPELVMETYTSFLGLSSKEFRFVLHRLDNYARAEDGALVPLNALGKVIEG
ncbi:TIGR03936 family radical SAM-associated protein [Lachnoclostridium sp. An181]|uniref:TIGR03936 family radical SAM-associated protein n=1 Tax=Lachnoclostridium sp. An181 TaxID=1965575 RepID=UPI000B392D7D|nr:TIGR03936 family radical SAM-associated protein [Lachnoclostridium sp. An181]OUP50815.1 Fe-S oxidoreductase [Lachnoclostridium sp. An181]